MAIPAADGNYRPTYVPPPPPPPPAPTPVAPTSSYRAEPTYSPLAPTTSTSTSGGPSGVGGTQYGIPEGSTLSQATSGTQAQPFDVTLSQLATAVYGTRGPAPAGWSEVTDQQLTALGVQDPQAWRLQHLGFNDAVQTNPQEFRAQVYTDGQGNYVLSYRGTAEGGPDWENNFRQGLGFETNQGDKFSVTAANTAVEFARVFGNSQGGDSSNLAITGHSQGGGLASVGSLASGVPAVTFDASGIHPNTFDRMGLDPQAARNVAEGGQIRAYSLSGDALTRAQDSWVTGLVAPDALGTQIVVDPASADANNMFTNYGPTEGIQNAPLVNTGVEIARNPLTGTLLSAPAGFLLGGVPGALIAPIVTVGGGNLAYAAISHSPNALTAAMVERQPWQPGYENPSSWSRDLQNLLPDTLKDDYARNTHDFVTDIGDVVATDFANGEHVRGGFRIAGDFAEGFFNSAGDTLDAGIDGLGGLTDRAIDGTGQLVNRGIDAAGNLTESGFNLAGGLADGGIDLVGDGVELLGDAGGQGLRDLGNTVGLPGLGNAAGSLLEGGTQLANQGIDLVGDGVERFADGLGTTANAAIDFVGDGVEWATDGLGDAANATIDVMGDGVELLADGFGTAAEATADVVGTMAQGVTDGAQAVGDFLNPFN